MLEVEGEMDEVEVVNWHIDVVNKTEEALGK
jgi:hypothetical protein